VHRVGIGFAADGEGLWSLWQKFPGSPKVALGG